MSIQSEITRLSGNISAALTAISNKGVTVPVDATSDDLATLIAQIETGGGALSTEVILPEQTVTVSGEETLLTGNTEQLVIGNVYLLTVNGESKITTAQEVYNDPTAIFLYYVRFVGYGNRTYLTVYQESLYGTYTVKVEKVLGLEYLT